MKAPSNPEGTLPTTTTVAPPPIVVNSTLDEIRSTSQREEEAISPGDMLELQLRIKKHEVEKIEQEVRSACLNNWTIKLENIRCGVDIVMRIVAMICVPVAVSSWLKYVMEVIQRQQSKEQNIEKLSDPIGVALLASTSVTVIGLVTIIASYLFRTALLAKKEAEKAA